MVLHPAAAAAVRVQIQLQERVQPARLLFSNQRKCLLIQILLLRFLLGLPVLQSMPGVGAEKVVQEHLMVNMVVVVVAPMPRAY